MANPHKYAGILATKREPLTLNPENSQIESAFRIIYERHTEALIHALFADCGAGQFNPNLEKGLGSAHTGWRKVAMTLAERHIEGFQHASNARKGRPKRTDDGKIWAAVTQRLANGERLRHAARYVAKERQKGEMLDAIESAYRRYVKNNPDFDLDIRQKSKRNFAAKSGKG
jgi:hypothetical protein